MEYEIVQVKEKIVEGLEIVTSNFESDMPQKIEGVWQQLFASGVYGEIGNKINTKTIGLYTDYEGDVNSHYHFICGVEVSELSRDSKQRVIKKIPAGTYAKFVVRGNSKDTVNQFWTTLWGMPLDRNYIADFEEYQNDTADSNLQSMHVYIGING